MMMIPSLILGFLLACLPSSWGQLDLPPSGAYFSFSNAAMETVMATVTGDIQNEINSYTGWATKSGESSSASYTFQDWQVSIAMIEPQWKVIGYNQIAIGWKEFNFSIESDYHVCARSWPNPCEDGNLYIWTADPYTQLYIEVNITLSEDPAFINVTTAQLNFRNNGVEIYVDCTDTFCLIPTSDIAYAVANEFVGLFTTAVANSARNVIMEHASSVHFTFDLSDGLGLDMSNGWWMLPGATGGENGFILVPSTGGFFTDVNGVVTYPPYNISFTPPDDFLDAPDADFNLVLCDYFFDSLLWALGNINFFSRSLNASMVPADSPVKLNTADAFFQQVIPGLTKFPNMDITVNTQLIEVAVPTLTPQGLEIYGMNVSLDFSLSNSSYQMQGWSLNVEFDIFISVGAALAGSDITFSGKIVNFTSAVTVTQTNVGSIIPMGFVTLFQLLESQISIPDHAFTVPAAFTLSNPSLTLYEHYMAFTANATYNAAQAFDVKPKATFENPKKMSIA